eukprot:1149920-Pelagomonas_calceolata.AAC.2
MLRLRGTARVPKRRSLYMLKWILVELHRAAASRHAALFPEQEDRRQQRKSLKNEHQFTA